MKGVVFKEFIGLVEEAFGDNVAEKVISNSKLASEGAYTAVGTYDHNEILELVTNLSKETNTSIPDLVQTFGKHLAKVFKSGYPTFFEQPDAFSFLKSVDGIIHVEVRKLYPDAELPKFEYEEPSQNELKMKYSSSRPFADLAEGLISGVIEHYGENIEMVTTDTSGGAGTSREFHMTRG